MRTLREIQQPSFPVLRESDTFRAFLGMVDVDGVCPEGTPVPVADQMSGRLLGHVNRPGIEDLMSRLDEPVLQVLQPMVTLRARDSLFTAWRRLTRNDATVMSLVDDEGRLLGTVCLPELQKALLDAFAMNADCTLLLLEKDRREISLRDIIQSADAEGVRVLGLQHLGVTGQTREPVLEQSLAESDALHSGDVSESASSSEASPDTEAATILLQVQGAEINGLIQSLRRQGYIVYTDQATEAHDQELSEKADAFLHFLDI